MSRLVPLPDISFDGLDDLAILRDDPIRLDLIDPTTGDTIGSVPFFDSDFAAVAAAALPDSDGNGVAEAVVLGFRTADRRLIAEVRNLSGPSLRRRVYFAPDADYVDFAVTPVDINGNGVPELALLMMDSNGRPWSQVKDALSGSLVGSVGFDPAYVPSDLHVVRDIAGGGDLEAAVVGIDGLGRVRAQIKDIVTRQLASLVYFNRNYPAHATTGLDRDLDGQTDALAVLGRNASGIVRAQVKDVQTSAGLSFIRFESGYEPRRIVTLPDLDESGEPELGVLQLQVGTVRVQIKDAVSGAPVSVVPLAAPYAAIDLAVLPDLDGNGKSEIAYLGEAPIGTYLLQIKDAVTGNAIVSLELP